ncbi:MAG: methylated-DNA--[protein]-cysteine S-methyltransferase [Candidatus Lernaella stagnicola]|nr:methylated-DNA--[protein]-cysteine S-methyltransferase [Candidatus Lernaella stagnicola]
MIRKTWNAEHYHHLLKSKLGEIALIWSDESFPRVLAILLPGEEQRQAVAATSRGRKLPPLAARLADYLAGKPVRFSLRELDWTGISEFRREVMRACVAIRRGSVTTYGKLAEQAGRKNAARAVGAAMARNPFPLVIPCHRVVASDGHLHGFGGGMEALALKRRLLEHEGHVMRDEFHAMLP